MSKKIKKGIALLIMCLATFVVVIFGASSLAKYQFKITENLIGHYVDYRLVHDGEGQNAVLHDLPATNDGGALSYYYDYEGYITLNISNFLSSSEVSQRDIKLEFRTPTKDEVDNGIYDAWKNRYDVEHDSLNYEIEIADELGNALTDQTLTFPQKVETSYKISLKINRLVTNKANVVLDDINDVEELTIVIHTSMPYNDIHLFNIKVSNKLIMISSVEDQYFGFDELEVNVKTGNQYNFQVGSNNYSSYNPVKLDFTYTGNIMFDYKRFELEYENNLTELNATQANNYQKGYLITENKNSNGEVISKTLTINVPSASSLKLNFYLLKDKKGSINVTANFKYSGGTYSYTSLIAGITNGNVYSL